MPTKWYSKVSGMGKCRWGTCRPNVVRISEAKERGVFWGGGGGGGLGLGLGSGLGLEARLRITSVG
jgi:hypothetical protein